MQFRSLFRGHRHFLLFTVIVCSVLTVLRVKPQLTYANERITTDNYRSKYVGDAVCMQCHAEEGAPYQHTAHHLTSQLATRDSILGSFRPGENLLLIENPQTPNDGAKLFFQMEQNSDGFFQSAIAETENRRLVHTSRIDLVFGAGVRGQTYLSWREDVIGVQASSPQAARLFELPVSFWSEGRQWINSPGYRDGTANFERRVNPRCIECHATYILPLSKDPQTNVYDRSSLVPGISCETCHGPGGEHVALQVNTQNRSKSSDSRILNPAHFDRDRQIDGCALCHDGTSREELTPAFTYTPGADLSNFLAASAADLVDHPDVHGNQVGLLKRSRCFISSPQMTCSTCHNIHSPERPAADYSHQCLSCHRWQSCRASHRLGPSITKDCIRCHMPLQETEAIVSETAGRVIHTSIRTHWIKVYPDVSSDGGRTR